MKYLRSFLLCQLMLAAVSVVAVSSPATPADTAHFYMKHSYDALKYRLDITLNQCFTNPYPRTFNASEIVTLKADSAISSVILNAISTSIVVDSVSMAGISFTHVNDTLTITLDRLYQPGEILDIRIRYHHLNVNDQGFYSFYGTVFTDNPPEGARKWLPCWDRPSDKVKWELYARVPANVRLGSNGVLCDSVITGDTITYHWKTDYQIATYLITFSGKVNYLIHKQYWKPPYAGDSIPILAYYRAGENMTNIDSVIGPSTTFFSSLFGPYPFEKIGFATLNNIFPWGGMENQTFVNLMPGGYGSESLLIHEHSHQWFGDLVTCGTWADVWLNEGFATYCRELWVEHAEGYDTYKQNMDGLAQYYLTHNPGWPLYQPEWAIHTPDGNSLYHQGISYDKGACVLHILRYVLGDTLFFRALKEYATDPDFMYGNAVTGDFVAKVSAVAGTDMSWFFDEWVYAPNHPVYDNTYEIDSLGPEQWKVTFIAHQTQENTVFFKMPLELEISFTGAPDTLIRVMNDTNHQPFSFYFTNRPDTLVFDPSWNILMKKSNTAYGIGKKDNRSGSLLKNAEPNPFTDHVTVTYQVINPSNVKISVIDSGGKWIKSLVNSQHAPGIYHVDLTGRELAPGAYMLWMEAGDFRATRKLIHVK